MKVQINGSEVFYGTGSGTPKDTAQTLIFVHGAGFDLSLIHISEPTRRS